MSANNRGRSTTGEPAVPYYLSTPAKEAAKHLRLTVTRYLADRASLREIEEAWTMLRSVAPLPGDKEPLPLLDEDADRLAASRRRGREKEE